MFRVISSQIGQVLCLLYDTAVYIDIEIKGANFCHSFLLVAQKYQLDLIVNFNCQINFFYEFAHFTKILTVTLAKENTQSLIRWPRDPTPQRSCSSAESGYQPGQTRFSVAVQIRRPQAVAETLRVRLASMKKNILLYS